MEAAWPERLFRTTRTHLTTKDVDRIRSELAELNRPVAEDTSRDTIGLDEAWLYPARLLMVDRLGDR